MKVNGICINCQEKSKFSCSNCGQVSYCGRECQVSHWKKRHKFDCHKTILYSDHDEDSNDFDEPNEWLFDIEEMKTLMNPEGVQVPIAAGMINKYQNCYLNSVIQCLIHTRPLSRYLYSQAHGKKCKMSKTCMFCVLQKHAMDAYLGTGGKVESILFLKKLKKLGGSFEIGRHEDAHEFLVYMIDNMQTSALNGLGRITYRNAETSVVGQIFGGHTLSQIKCPDCGYKSNKFDAVEHFSLDIYNAESLADAFQQYTHRETVEGYKCSGCKESVDAQKRTSIYKPPNILVVQMKRFGTIFGKITKHMPYPFELPMAPYMADETEEADKEPVYGLYALVYHHGRTAFMGHYIAIVFHEGSGKWYVMDDDKVYPVETASDVLQVPAYLLFYIRVDQFEDEEARARRTARLNKHVKQEKEEDDSVGNSSLSSSSASSSSSSSSSNLEEMDEEEDPEEEEETEQ
eukprot:TRINITY_DN221_c0_g2_i4.p1 TRINITY_DN221_c0_g2~~TRINITY_DN221_c0_g2_i4.p1  ORF type:complete len:459 (+),score=162.20 TRINITY_DN221_c0_g2_i4:1305-2681(+)